MNELKKLMEKRADLLEKMQTLTTAVETEQRAFSKEENESFDNLKTEIENIDQTVKAIEQARALRKPAADIHGRTNEVGEDQTNVEIRAFANIIRNRADSNITKTDNGAVIPQTIANKIIDSVKDISPLFRDAEKFNIKGAVSIPYVDTDNDNITVAYADEFTELEAKSTKLLSVDLSDFLTGALAKISRGLLNSTDVDLVNFVIQKMATSVAIFVDREILVGTTGKVKGLSTVKKIIAAAASAAISMDEIIKLKDQLKTAFQNGAYFVMAPETLTAVRLLKDNNGRYYVNDDVTAPFGVTLLGKPVYITDQCPAMTAGNCAIFYLNPTLALAAKLVEDSVQVLYEKYATQHAIGVVDWFDFDCEIQNQQAVAALKMKAAA